MLWGARTSFALHEKPLTSACRARRRAEVIRAVHAGGQSVFAAWTMAWV